MHFCPGHNFQSIEASNFKLLTQIDHIKVPIAANGIGVRLQNTSKSHS